MFAPHRLTKDGYESQFGVNYLSHFYLSHLMMGKLAEGATSERAARIVNVSSCAHYAGSWMDLDDINGE